MTQDKMADGDKRLDELSYVLVQLLLTYEETIE